MVRNLKTAMQLGGIVAIAWALYQAWHGLPVRDAILNSAASLTTVQGPGSSVEVVEVAQQMVIRLFSTPWFLVGIALILVPYLIEMLVRALPQPAPPRY